MLFLFFIFHSQPHQSYVLCLLCCVSTAAPVLPCYPSKNQTSHTPFQIRSFLSAWPYEYGYSLSEHFFLGVGCGGNAYVKTHINKIIQEANGVLVYKHALLFWEFQQFKASLELFLLWSHWSQAIITCSRILRKLPKPHLKTQISQKLQSHISAPPPKKCQYFFQQRELRPLIYQWQQYCINNIQTKGWVIWPLTPIPLLRVLAWDNNGMRSLGTYLSWL